MKTSVIGSLKRTLCAALALVMLAGLSPAYVRADDGAKSVTYNRARPEVAVLNYYTGSDEAFYRKLKGNTSGNAADLAPYWQYNAITLFKHQDTQKPVQYSERAEGNVWWDFYLTSDSVLKQLIKPSKNLEVNASATFYNRTHTHTNFELKSFSNWETTITSFHSMTIGIGGSYGSSLNGRMDKDRKYPRLGDLGGTGGGYKTLNYYQDKEDDKGRLYCSLHFYPSVHEWTDFAPRTCECGKTYAENVLVTFRDTRAPQIENIYYSLDNGKTWTPRYTRAAVGKGGTVLIKLSFDEPIRFADDSAAGKGGLYLDLRGGDGEDPGTYKAYLTELSGNDLIFSYTVPASQTTDAVISTMDMNSLFASSVKLVQVVGSTNFTIKDADDREGFGKTTCYITDLAGNPMRSDEKTIVDANLTLDSGAPYVASVDFKLTTNNADVKAELGKADKGPGTEGYDENSYTDASDLYLGAGDSFYLIVHMNERLKGIGMDKNSSTGRYIINWQHAVFETNLLDENGKSVEIRSAYYYSFYDYDYDPTQFITDRVTIGEGWKLASGDKIMVTGMRFDKKAGEPGTLESEVSDLAGNAIVGNRLTVESKANPNPPQLDTAAPTVTGIVNSYTKEGNGFLYGVRLSDTESGFAGISGSFILNNGGDGKAYQYEWAVTADAETAVSSWMPGVIGTAYTFDQTPEVYFHIRPKDGETYVDLSGCTITVKARDFAGNVSNASVRPEDSNGSSWYIDNLAPTAEAGEVTRKLDGSGDGVLTVGVTFTDSHGVSAWQYAWTDSADTEPQTWTTPTHAATTNTTVNVTVTETVANGELFSKYLWVKAKDNSDKKNESDPICLGRFSYDLRGAEYELDYPRSFTDYAVLKVTKQGAEDTLFFLVPAEGGSEYYAVYKSISAGNYDIFSQTLDTGAWEFYKLTVSGQDYILTPDDTQQAADQLKKLLPGGGNKFSGDLAIKVLAGKSTAYEESETGVLTLGSSSNKFGEDTVNMRLSGYASDLFGAITLTCEGNLGKRSVQSYWKTSEGYTQRTTLEGLRFTVTIDGDNRGWKYENLDWKNSYILLKSEEGTSYPIPLNRFQISAEDPNGAITQTVTVPAGDYKSGVYYASVVIKTVSGEREFDWPLSTGTTTDIVVDTREPNSNFSLSSIIYAPQAYQSGRSSAYGLDQSYGDGGELECVPSDGGVIYLPISQGGTYIAEMPEYYITVSSPDEKDMEQHKTTWTSDAYTGRYSVQLWNTAYADSKIEIVPYSVYDKVQTEATTQGANVGSPNYDIGFTFNAGEQSGTKLYLETGKVNTVAVQKVYENGRRSDIKYYSIMPVDDAVTGTVSIDKANMQLVFWPTDGVSAAGATVFAWASQNGEDAISGEGQRIEMTAQQDGTWRCALLSGGAFYEVITVSANGSICDAGSASQRTPWFDDMPSMGSGSYKDHGVENLSLADNGNGTYTLTFRVRDDLDTMKDGLTVDIGFNEGYSKHTFSLTYQGKNISWTTDSGDPTGIYAVTATKGAKDFSGGGEYAAVYRRDYLDVTVEGVFANVAGDMDVTVTATDAFGNAGTVSSTGNAVNYQAPTVESNAKNGVTFSQPVRPVESWAWHEKDGSGFKTAWPGAFPISGNGTWTIRFRDAFGQAHAAEVSVDDFTENGIDYSIDLGFSTTDITSEAVTMTTNAANGTVKVYEVNGTTHTEMTPVDGFPGVGTQKRQTRIYKNMETQVELKDADGGTILRLRVYIDNIITGAPEADVRYYVEQLGQEFTAEELETYVGSGLTVTGNVRVWYNTERHVTPTDGTGTEFVFTPGGATSHTFTFVDDFGVAGSAEAKLPAGLKLEAYKEPPADTTAPDVSIDVYVKRGGVYTRAASILDTDSSDAIAAKLAALSYVQGYSLTINASDPSGFTIAATGGTLTGNVLTITEKGEVTITVTDGAEAQNSTVIRFTVPDLIDNVAPTAVVSTETTSMYTKNLYIKVNDNSGHAELTFPVGLDIVPDTAADRFDKKHIGEYKYVVTDNETLQFTVRDIAGNTATISHGVTGIDTDPPKLTVSWSPSEDEQYPPNGPVNTNITAHIDSDKAMSGLSVRIDGTSTELLRDGKWVYASGTEYTILGQNSVVLASIFAAPERVTVTYFQTYAQTMTFTATAPNGRSREVDIRCTTDIDKDAPFVTQGVETRYDRKGNVANSGDNAYKVIVELTPNEAVVSPNYGETELYQGEHLPVIYNPYSPLKITFTTNGTYNVLLTDQAGNTTVCNVTVTGIDRTAPKLTLGEPVVSGQTADVEVTVNEPCTVTWGESGSYEFTAAGSHEITFTQNGTFAVTATDAAGNESFEIVTVGSIDDIPPTISFTSGTIYVKAGITDAELRKELSKGVTVQDNSGAAPTVGIDTAAVDLNTAGQYTVTYTVSDKAGNVTTATRIVRVIGADTVCINIDGKLVMPDSTAVLRPGDHTLTLENNGTEPYSVKARAGVLSAGQMKYLSGSSLSFDASGKFTVTNPGYYTLLVTTQSRQTIRILLYVER